MSRTPTAVDRDRCDAFRKAYLAAKSSGSVVEPDPKKAAEALGSLMEAQEALTVAAADLKPALIRGRLDHAGRRFYLDRAGVIHCVKMPRTAIWASASGGDSRPRSTGRRFR